MPAIIVRLIITSSVVADIANSVITSSKFPIGSFCGCCLLDIDQLSGECVIFIKLHEGSWNSSGLSVLDKYILGDLAVRFSMLDVDSVIFIGILR